MKTLKGREESIEYVLNDDFINCPAGFTNFCYPFAKKFEFCNRLFNQTLSNCPCIVWNKTYAKEYYWMAMNPFFE